MGMEHHPAVKVAPRGCWLGLHVWRSRHHESKSGLASTSRELICTIDFPAFPDTQSRTPGRPAEALWICKGWMYLALHDRGLGGLRIAYEAIDTNIPLDVDVKLTLDPVLPGLLLFLRRLADQGVLVLPHVVHRTHQIIG